MEPHRTSPLRLHHSKLARQTLALPCRDRATDRRHHDQGRARCPLLSRRQQLPESHQGLRRPKWPRSTSSPTTSTANGTTQSPPPNPPRDAVVSSRTLGPRTGSPSAHKQDEGEAGV